MSPRGAEVITKVLPSRLEAIIEKKSMINLVLAFGVSVKHFLRGEPAFITVKSLSAHQLKLSLTP